MNVPINRCLRPGQTGLALALLLAAPSALGAQEVRGRLLREPDGAPLVEALILLIDDLHRERARTVTSASGGFALKAPADGRYRVRVQRIGQRGWESAPLELAASGVAQVSLHVPDVPVVLPELEVLAQRPRCGVTLGDASVGAALLEAAQTALGLAEAEANHGRRTYVTANYRRTEDAAGNGRDSSVVRGQLSGWPIQTAAPDSLRAHGFVDGDWPAPNLVSRREVGPTYYGIDARVLFTDWFLASHCIVVDTASDARNGSATLLAQFRPAKGTRTAASLTGQLVFDRATLALRVLRFEFVNQAAWAPRGSARGEVRFARLPDGAWVPVRWYLRAPLPAVTADRTHYRYFGATEVGGRVTAIRSLRGEADTAAQSAVESSVTANDQ